MPDFRSFLTVMLLRANRPVRKAEQAGPKSTCMRFTTRLTARDTTVAIVIIAIGRLAQKKRQACVSDRD
jgi:hypothetical protein